MKRIVTAWFGCLTLASLISSAPVAADERQPAADGAQRGARDGAPRGERQPAADGAPRGERNASGSRDFSFPAEVTLTDEQRTKIKELETTYAPKMAEMLQKRDGILTSEQKAARTEVEKKLRDGGLGRQEAAEMMAAAVKLSDEQKTQLVALEQESGQLRREIEQKKMAILTQDQKDALRKSMATANAARMFGLPGEIVLTDEQKTALKALETELVPKIVEAQEKYDAVMTDERKATRESAARIARNAATRGERVGDAALNLSDAERTQLAEAEQSMQDLRKQIQERKLALLTSEQRAQLEQLAPSSRARN